VYKILHPFLDWKALSTVGRCNTFFEEYWQYVTKQLVIQVPEDFPTMNQAMDLAVVFSERNECTTENPVRVEVGEGVHVMVGVVHPNDDENNHTTHVSCSNITIVGKGKSNTAIYGGFIVHGKQNVKIEQLTIKNEAGFGLLCVGSGTTVDVTECCFNKCRSYGMFAREGATATATRCDFIENGECGVVSDGANTKFRLNDSTAHHNKMHGVLAFAHAAVDIHGTKTDIHSNIGDGVCAIMNAKVNIHLSSQHNTTHDNGGENREQRDGGSIANINTDGTFTHVGDVEEDEE